MAIFQKKFYSVNNRKKPSPQLQLRFLKQLTKLLGNGYSLIDSLEIIAWDSELKNLSHTLKQMLTNGTPLAMALEKIYFHHIITSYLSFVQSSGDLKQHIDKCVIIYEQRVAYLKKVNQIMRYPLLLVFIFLALLFFINTYVLPAFLDLFHTNLETSITISQFMTMISIFGKTVSILSIILIFIWIMWKLFNKNIRIKQRIQIYRSIPIYRSFMTLHTSFLFASHLSTLLKSGMTIKEILQHMASQKNVPIISYYSSLLISEFTRGAQIDQLLKQLPLIDKQFAVIFQNNNIDNLAKELTVYADMLIDQFNRKMVNIITMIQPVIFTVLALFIIFIYIALMWPMFDLIKTI